MPDVWSLLVVKLILAWKSQLLKPFLTYYHCNYLHFHRLITYLIYIYQKKKKLWQYTEMNSGISPFLKIMKRAFKNWHKIIMFTTKEKYCQSWSLLKYSTILNIHYIFSIIKWKKNRNPEDYRHLIINFSFESFDLSMN